MGSIRGVLIAAAWFTVSFPIVGYAGEAYPSRPIRMRIPVAAHRASIPVAWDRGIDFKTVIFLAPLALLSCHHAGVRTSRAASPMHSIRHRRPAGNSVRGGRQY